MFVSPVSQGASNPRAVFARKSHTVHTAVLAVYFWLAFPCKPWPFAVIWGEGVAPCGVNQAQGETWVDRTVLVLLEFSLRLTENGT